MKLTGQDMQRIVGECTTNVGCPTWWDELAKKVNEHYENGISDNNSVSDRTAPSSDVR